MMDELYIFQRKDYLNWLKLYFHSISSTFFEKTVDQDHFFYLMCQKSYNYYCLSKREKY